MKSKRGGAEIAEEDAEFLCGLDTVSGILNTGKTDESLVRITVEIQTRT